MEKTKTTIRKLNGDVFSVESHTWDLEGGWLVFKNWTDVETRKFNRIVMFRESEVESFYEFGELKPG